MAVCHEKKTGWRRTEFSQRVERCRVENEEGGTKN